MANIEKIQEELEDLRKEAMPALKSLNAKIDKVDNFVSNITQIQNSISNLSSAVDDLTTNLTQTTSNLSQISQNVTQLSSSVAEVSQNMNGLTDTVNQVSQNVEGLNTAVNQVSETVDTLSTTVNQVSQTVTEITDVTIPNLQNQINNAGGGTGGGSSGSEEENWQTIYDMTSDDPLINWGLTGGILKNYNREVDWIDLTQYKKMRVTFRRDSHYVFEYSLLTIPYAKENNLTNGYAILFVDPVTPNTLWTSTVNWVYSANKLYFAFIGIYSLNISNGKYPRVTNYNDVPLNGLIKVELLPK